MIQDRHAGHAVYSAVVLRTYDWLVHRLSNPLLWRCPTSELRALYDRNVSDTHVDIGVATGYFLDKAKWPVARPSITLIDLNPNCLAEASRRIARYDPRTVLADALAPLPAVGRYRSAGLCMISKRPRIAATIAAVPAGYRFTCASANPAFPA